MAVIKTTEIEDIIGLAHSTKRDDRIKTLLPMVQADLCEYLNNYFEDPVIYRDGDGNIEFVRGDTSAAVAADYITDTGAKFSSIGFSTEYGFDIMVRVGGPNAGIHHVVSLTSEGNKLTLDSTGALYNLDMDGAINYPGGCKISLVTWPKAIKPYVAQMIMHRIDRPKPSGAISERIDDYAITYVGGYSYPAETIEGLKKWRNAVLI